MAHIVRRRNGREDRRAELHNLVVTKDNFGCIYQDFARKRKKAILTGRAIFIYTPPGMGGLAHLPNPDKGHTAVRAQEGRA